MADQYVAREFPTDTRRKRRPKRPIDGLPFFSRDPRQMWLPLDRPSQKEGRSHDVAEAAQGEEKRLENTLLGCPDQAREGR